MTELEHLEAGLLAFMKVINERTDASYVEELKRDNADEYRMMIAAIGAAMEAGNKRRVEDLLDANNRYLQEARDARTEVKGLRDILKAAIDYNGSEVANG